MNKNKSNFIILNISIKRLKIAIKIKMILLMINLIKLNIKYNNHIFNFRSQNQWDNYFKWILIFKLTHQKINSQIRKINIINN